MATTMDFDPDKRFSYDNLLLNDDWEPPGDMVMGDDLSQLLDLEDLQGLEVPDDLQMPLLDDPDLEAVAGQLEDPWQLSDSSDSGVSECFQPVKLEPLSPLSQCSENSTDSMLSQTLMDFLPSPSDLSLGSDCLMPTSTANTCSLIRPQPQTSGAVSLLEPQVHIKTELPDTPPRTPPMGMSHSISSASTSLLSNVSQVATTSSTSTVLQGLNGYKIVLPANSKLGSNVSQVKGEKGVQKFKVQTVKSVPPIQPKSSTASTTSSSSKPLVLTQEEFAKLAAQGVLKLTSPVNKQLLDTKPRLAAPKVTASATRVTPVVATHSHIQASDTDFKIMKRQQRMIKNRESACLSRKRKKEKSTDCDSA